MQDFQLVTVVALIALWCSTLQSVVGFGYGLFSVPLLLMAGMQLPEAVLITVMASAIQRGTAVYKMRKSVDWRTVLPMTALAICFVPVGLFLMKLLTAHEKGLVRQCIGGVILVGLLVQLFARIERREKVHAAWGFLAACLHGILNGLANIGGPPIVLWIHAHDWPNEKIRVTQVAISFPLVPFQLALLYMTFASQIDLMPATKLGLASVPAVFAGVILGLTFGKKVSVKWLRKGAYLLLTLLCLSAILGPLVKG